VDPEISGEAEKGRPLGGPDLVEPKRKITWRKVGRAFLFILASVLVFLAGYLAMVLWQRYVPGSFLTGPSPYENWLVYRSENYDLGLRYPDNWEATEVNASLVTFQPKPQQEGEVLPKDYLGLTISPSGSRTETACEKEETECSFHANGIFGDRSSTPEQEVIFFSKAGNDFTLTWYKYGEADYAPVFEEMGKSLRFTAEETPEVNENP